MKAANILIVGLAAAALTGCSAYDYARNAVAPHTRTFGRIRFWQHRPRC